ncbi:hypothetical protein [Flavobacterium sp.]|uniref:hypothetical protein n=1 Tax=Flavobacterium sp. TaxID=239 RepID=UPI002487461D|nr:hypothetical protein [Flavobacterium sp.]MDI1317872.1 hypothetical protein [Flavobacterium sp.]
MKFFIAAFLIGAFNIFAQPAAKVDKKYGKDIPVVRVKATPVWAKAAPANVNYYYLPDIETYYDVPAQRYIYLNNGSWVRTSALPARYKGYNMYNSSPVYLTDYKGNSPYTLYKVHKVKYKGKGRWKSNYYKKEHRNHEKDNDHDNHHGKKHGKKD